METRNDVVPHKGMENMVRFLCGRIFAENCEGAGVRLQELPVIQKICEGPDLLRKNDDER